MLALHKKNMNKDTLQIESIFSKSTDSPFQSPFESYQYHNNIGIQPLSGDIGAPEESLEVKIDSYIFILFLIGVLYVIIKKLYKRH